MLMRLYHGTNASIEGQLRPHMPAYPGSIGEGIYLSENRETASGYGSNVHIVEVQIDKPLIIDACRDGDEINYRIAPEIEEHYQQTGGFDSILVGETIPPFDVLIGGQWHPVRDRWDMESIGDLAERAGHDAVFFYNVRHHSSLNDEILLLKPEKIVRQIGIEPAKQPKSWYATASEKQPLTACGWCKREIVDGKPAEVLPAEAFAACSHTICGDCRKQLFPQYDVRLRPIAASTFDGAACLVHGKVYGPEPTHHDALMEAAQKGAFPELKGLDYEEVFQWVEEHSWMELIEQYGVIEGFVKGTKFVDRETAMGQVHERFPGFAKERDWLGSEDLDTIDRLQPTAATQALDEPPLKWHSRHQLVVLFRKAEMEEDEATMEAVRQEWHRREKAYRRDELKRNDSLWRRLIAAKRPFRDRRQIEMELPPGNPQPKSSNPSAPTGRKVMRHRLELDDPERHRFPQPRPREWSVSPRACCPNGIPNEVTREYDCTIHGHTKPKEINEAIRRPPPKQVRFGPFEDEDKAAKVAVDFEKHGLIAFPNNLIVVLEPSHWTEVDTAKRLIQTWKERHRQQKSANWFHQVGLVRLSAKKKVLAVDFDETIAEKAEYPKIGKPMEGVREGLLAFRKAGWRILIYTCRLNGHNARGGSEEYQKNKHDLKAWLSKHKVPYDGFAEWSDGKVFADLYLDDKGWRFTSWDEAVKILDAV
jgi:hypothetical protein